MLFKCSCLIHHISHTFNKAPPYKKQPIHCSAVPHTMGEVWTCVTMVVYYPIQHKQANTLARNIRITQSWGQLCSGPYRWKRIPTLSLFHSVTNQITSWYSCTFSFCCKSIHQICFWLSNFHCNSQECKKNPFLHNHWDTVRGNQAYVVSSIMDDRSKIHLQQRKMWRL